MNVIYSIIRKRWEAERNVWVSPSLISNALQKLSSDVLSELVLWLTLCCVSSQPILDAECKAVVDLAITPGCSLLGGSSLLEEEKKMTSSCRLKVKRPNI